MDKFLVKEAIKVQYKQKHVFIIFGCALILVCIVLFVNVNALTPQKAQIVFVSSRDQNCEIYVMDVDGKNQRNLTNNLGEDYQPAWSKDGQKIAFVSMRDKDPEIYVMDADGENQRRITKRMGLDYYPTWSPDGKIIAFTVFPDGIYVMDPDGKNQRSLTDRAGYPNWFDPDFIYAVSSAGKFMETWGWIKHN